MSQILFLSTVTTEFGSFRQRLAAFLQRTKRVHVRHQDDFFHHGVKTLRMLEEEVAASNLFIHVIGKESGWCPPVDQVEDFLTRNPSFGTHFPDLLYAAKAGTVSATQWEIWLAVFFRIERVLTYEFQTRLQPESSQAIHSARLQSLEWHSKAVVTEDDLYDEIIGSLWQVGFLEGASANQIDSHEGVISGKSSRIQLPRPRDRKLSDRVPLVNSPEIARQRQLELCQELLLPSAKQNYAGIDFQIIPSGRFLMGACASDRSSDADEHPQTLAEVSKPLLVSTYPVSCSTVRDVLSQMQMTQSRRNWMIDSEEMDDALPAVELSASEVEEICAELSLRIGARCRLPTEAEWEYFARAGATTPFWWGVDFSPGNVILGTDRPSPPAAHRCNSWGLCDILGNVAEWTSSRYGTLDSQYPLQPCTAEQFAGYYRAVRGGSFRDNDPAEVRLSARRRIDSSVKAVFIGFRIVLDLPSEAFHE